MKETECVEIRFSEEERREAVKWLDKVVERILKNSEKRSVFNEDSCKKQ